MASSPQSYTTKLFHLLPSILSPQHIIPAHCNVPQLHEKLPHSTDFPPLHPPSAANCDSLSTHTGPLALVGIMRMIYTETTPSAANQVAKNEHITSLLWILPELYLLLLHKLATFILTHPWQSNHCSTFAQTQQHNHSTFHSLPTPQHATIALTPPYWQTSTSLGPRLPPRPTNPTLKTFSTLSLPIQTTSFNTMNAVNLDMCTSPPPPIHLSSTVMRSLVNSC